MLRRHEFTIKIIVLLLLFSFFPMILMNRIWFGMSKTVKTEEVVRSSRDMMIQMSGTMDYYNGILDQNASMIIYDEDICRYLALDNQEVSQAEQEKWDAYIQSKTV